MRDRGHGGSEALSSVVHSGPTRGRWKTRAGLWRGWDEGFGWHEKRGPNTHPACSWRMASAPPTSVFLHFGGRVKLC